MIQLFCPYNGGTANVSIVGDIINQPFAFVYKFDYGMLLVFR